MLGIELRPARIDDAAELARKSRDWIESGLRWRYTPRRIEACLHDSETLALVGWAHAELIGFAVMEFRFPDSRAHLLLLGVDPGYRRRGVGRRLLDWFDPIARLGGVHRISVEVRARSEEARRFYAAQNYAELGRMAGYYQGREDAIRMQRRLLPARARAERT